MGKAIYKPTGKAAEYSQWACNFYVGCSNNCQYCYLKKGRGAKILGGDKPQLKKCFKDEEHAIEIFRKEADENFKELRSHGLFLSFTTDPMLPETIDLTLQVISYCAAYSMPVCILTKKTGGWVDYFIDLTKREFSINNIGSKLKKLIFFGFTLTGRDELEPGASTNQERIEAMKKLHNAGFKTWASIEPVIDFESSYAMICDSMSYCDHYKIGLESGKKYDKGKIIVFMDLVTEFIGLMKPKTTIYFKDSILKQAGIDREKLPSNCVNANFKFWE